MTNLWKKLPKLPRWGKLLRNLLLCALVLAALPWVTDWPTNDPEEVFRRVERQALLSPSELILQKGDAFLTEGEDWIAVGNVEEYSSSWKPFQKKIGYINNVLPKGGLVVVALPDASHGNLVVAVTGIPEGAVTGSLEMVVSGVDSAWTEGRVADEETFTDRAFRDEDRPEWMFFTLVSHGDHPGLNRHCIMDYLWHELTLGDGVAPFPYTLSFEDENGKVLETCSGTLPRSNRFLYSDFWV